MNEMDKFCQRLTVSKLIQKEIKITNSPIAGNYQISKHKTRRPNKFLNRNNTKFEQSLSEN
jgi:hypothetical protein